jgi:predicted O-methyltransferase YrrM
MSELAIVLSVASLAIALLALHRSRTSVLALRLAPILRDAVARADHDTFRQLEALIGLYRELDPRRPFPPVGGWAASPDFLALLLRHAATGPRVIVECGSGASTVVLARACERNGRGHVWSLEHLPDMAARTRAWLDEQELERYATVIDAPLIPQGPDDPSRFWYAVEGLPDLPIDMVVVDGPPGSTAGSLTRYPAGPRLFPRLSEDGAVFLDDADRPEERATVLRWQQEFPLLVPTTVPCEKGTVVLTRRRSLSPVTG